SRARAVPPMEDPLFFTLSCRHAREHGRLSWDRPHCISSHIAYLTQSTSWLMSLDATASSHVWYLT
ncbi:MAG: hypothetical protein P8J37_15855, partial [Fuerstiella sp.]|nr:hypothetical protein [Fuerstiella sp.]